MATLDRIEPAYKSWSPSKAGFESAGVTDEEQYTGRHRKPSGRSFSLTRMFYVPRHRGR